MDIYTQGYLPAFSEWVDEYEIQPAPAPRLGVESLSGTAYKDFVIINGDGARTNVYTGLRGLILDFGVPGAALVVLLFGVGTGLAYRRTVAGSLTAAVVLGCAYASILFSPVTSLISFTNVTVAMVIAGVTLRRAARPVHRLPVSSPEQGHPLVSPRVGFAPGE